jgi:hypothetical protein
MRRTFWVTYILVIAFVIGFIWGRKAKADCDFVWKPGDTIYVEAGRPYHVIVESDDTQIFQRNLPVTVLPVAPIAHGTEIEDAIKAKPGAHWCGEYQDLTDTDVD